MNKKRSLYNLIYSIIGQVITICLGFILPRLFVVNYGSDVNGLLNSLSQVFVYMALFEAGVGAVSLRALYAPVANGDLNKINGILSATNMYYRRTGVLYLIALVILSFVYPVIVKTGMDYINVFLIILFFGMSNVVLFFFQGKYKILLQAEGKNYIITNLTTIITICVNIAKIACIYMGMDIVLIMVVTFFVNMIQALYIMYYIRTKYKWIDLKVPPDLESVQQKNAMLVHQIAGMIFQNTDILILTLICGLKEVSIYSMYKLVTMHIYSILNLCFGSISFALGQMFNTNIERFKRIIDVIESYFSALSFAVYFVALCLYIPFMKLYTAGVTDANYINLYLPWLFVIIEVLVAMRTPLLNTINYAGHFKLTLPQTILESVINLIVSLMLVFKIGIYGVLIGTICALMYRTIDIIIYTNIKILQRKPFKTFFIYIVNIFIFVVLYVAAQSVIPEITTYIQLIAVGALMLVVALAIFAGAQSVLFVKNKRELLREIFNGLKIKRKMK